MAPEELWAFVGLACGCDSKYVPAVATGGAGWALAACCGPSEPAAVSPGTVCPAVPGETSPGADVVAVLGTDTGAVADCKVTSGGSKSGSNLSATAFTEEIVQTNKQANAEELRIVRLTEFMAIPAEETLPFIVEARQKFCWLKFKIGQDSDMRMEAEI